MATTRECSRRLGHFVWRRIVTSRSFGTLNVYTQVMDDSLRTAVDRVGGELFTIVHQPGGAGVLTH
jgi:hypothetical protein